MVLRTIGETIRTGPVTHAGGSLESGAVFRYDKETRLVLMSSELWRELSLLGHWINDAVLVRWASLTQQFSFRQAITAGDVLPLLLARPEPLRATGKARKVYLEAGVSKCTWTDAPLRHDFAVDHVIPFSWWGNNDLWNLVPADPKANGKKSDKLPATSLLLDRRKQIIESWDVLRDAWPEAFDVQAQHLVGQTLSTPSSWQSTMFARLKDAIELTALQRGVERWPSS